MKVCQHPLYKAQGVEPWLNNEYIPAVVTAVDRPEDFDWPVKLLKNPKVCEWTNRRQVIAVRTDVYPLWWVYVWCSLQVENLAYIAWCNFMCWCNRLKLAKTKPGYQYHWKDFLRRYE